MGVRSNSPGAISLALLALFAVVWQVGYALELASDDQPTKIFWAKIQYFGIPSLATAWFAFTLQYTGRRQWLTRRNLALLSIVPIVTLVLAWTNEAHGLIWSDINLDTGDSLNFLVLDHGIWFWAYAAYSYLLLILGFILLAEALLHSLRPYWGQAIALLVSALVPWTTNWSFAVGLAPMGNLDLTPLAFMVSALALALAVVWTRFLDLTPIARKSVFENMNDGVLVLDAADRIADFNSAALRIFGSSAAESIGRPFTQLWPDGAKAPQLHSGGVSQHLELTLGQSTGRLFYEVSTSRLGDGRGRLVGHLILFHDNTRRRRVEEERERLFEEVSASRERLISLSRQLVEVQEAERRQLARDLHDEIGQVLTGLKFTLDAQGGSSIGGPRGNGASATELVDDLIERVRELSLNLRPAMLDDLGLLPALLWYVDRYTTQTSVRVT